MQNNKVQRVNYYYTKIVSIILPHVFYYIGSMHLIIIFVLLGKYKLNCLNNWKYIMCAIPVFAYNFGTMFLLSGAEDCFRFFYYTFLITPIILLILFKHCSQN